MKTTSDITAAQWAKHNNVELADKLGITASAVQQARHRLNAPPSPAPRGGDSTLPHGKPTDPTTCTIRCTKAQKRRWMNAKQRTGQHWDTWSAQALDTAAETTP